MWNFVKQLPAEFPIKADLLNHSIGVDPRTGPQPPIARQATPVVPHRGPTGLNINFPFERNDPINILLP